MDVFPLSAAAQQAINAYNKVNPKTMCAIDQSHRCDIQKCKYFVFKNVAVCKLSRHTHFCSSACTFGLQQVDGTFCMLTGRQTKDVEVKQFVNKTKMMYGKRVTNQHWTETKISQKHFKKKKGKCQNSTRKFSVHVRSILNTLFLSKERKELTEKAIAKQKDIEKLMITTSAPTFALYQKVYESRLKNNCLLNPVPQEIPESLTQYLIDMVQFVEKQASSKSATLKRTGHSVILGLIELLQKGFVVDGCELVTPSPFLKKFAPDVTQVGKLPNIRARQQTIATRLVKLALVTSSGEPLRCLPKCPI